MFQIGGIITDVPADSAVVARLVDAGLDWVSWYGWHYSGLEGCREAAAMLGSKAMVCYQIGDSSRVFLNRDDPPSREAIEAQLIPGVAGYRVWDEPAPDDTLAARNILLLSGWVSAAGIVPHTNLYGSARFTDAAYVAYLKQYASLPTLSFDEYPFQTGAATYDWFRTLRLWSQNVTTPWQAMIQLSPFRYPADSTFPASFSIVNTRWQAYTALAYGATGICYYQLGPASSPVEVWDNGIVDGSGDTTDIYSQVRTMNADLHRLGEQMAGMRPTSQSISGSTLTSNFVDSAGYAWQVVVNLDLASSHNGLDPGQGQLIRTPVRTKPGKGRGRGKGPK